jgi:uncharacterized protein YndB with AHSA1/START domain
MPHTLQITTPTDRELTMTRVFDAPRDLVWEALTKPELLKRWLGVHNGWVFETCELDLRVGGKYRYVWRSPTGYAMGMGGEYLEIVPREKIVSTEVFDDAWYEGKAVGTLTLTERNGQTTMSTVVKYDTKDIRDAVLKSPMESGVVAAYDTLEGLLPTLAVNAGE